MSTINLKSSIKLSVEAASGGAQTVVFTAKGQPCIMNKIKAFTLDSVGLGTGLHPAFITTKGNLDHIYIGTYAGTIVDNELVSSPVLSASVNLALPAYEAAAKASGKGFHIMTNAEWSALMVQAYISETTPYGNTTNGESIVSGTKGTLADPNSTTNYTIINGSGAASWRHDKKYNGISDLVGNVSEYAMGIRTIGGELQVIRNNNAALSTADTSVESVEWQAIDATTGYFKPPTFTGSSANSDYVATTTNSIRLDYAVSGVPAATTITAAATYSTLKYGSGISATALNVLRVLGIIPLAGKESFVGSTGVSGLNSNPYENLIARGGDFSSGEARTSLFTYRASRFRIAVYPVNGARLCYIPE